MASAIFIGRIGHREPSRLHQADGNVRIHAQIREGIREVAASRQLRAVALAAAIINLFGRMMVSVADNLAVARPDAGTEELSTALERVALDPGLLDHEARTLSGGELQRMCLARTLVTKPETLLLVGAALTLVISPGRSIWWSWLWVAAMLGYAATVARRRALEVPHLLPLALASFTAAAVVTLGVLFGLHVFPLTGRTLVPIAGMMIGNSMTATVLAGRRLTDELRDKRDEVEARLALGQASRQAAVPYVRAALRAALTPQIETTKATGLVFLPGVMTGLILAGTAPLQAVLVQAVVMFLILAATATTTVVIALGLIRRLFTPDHRLVYLPTSSTT